MKPVPIEAAQFDCEFFVLRTPLLAADRFLDWRGDAELAAGDIDYAQARARSLERMHALLARPEVKAALLVASPGLSERLEKMGFDMECAIARYLTRMSLRSTPFGLFAGVSHGELGERTEFELEPIAALRRHTRLDMGWLGAHVEALCADPTLAAELRYVPNDSLYRAGSSLHYFEGRRRKAQTNYYLVALREDQALRTVLQAARSGRTRGELAALLVDDEIDAEEAELYVQELIDSQVLRPDLGPAITSGDVLADQIAQLGSYPAAGAARLELGAIADSLQSLDAAGLDAPSAAQQALLDRLAALQPEARRSQLVQVDLLKPLRQGSLDRALVERLRVAFETLHSMFGGSGTDLFETFRREFAQRYGDAELPLCEVLDEERGIGYRITRGANAEAEPLLDGLVLVASSPSSRPEFRPIHRYLLERIEECWRDGSEEIDIDAAALDAAGIPTASPQLPDAYAIMARVWHSADGGWEGSVQSGGGPSGARLLGRFAPLDAALHARLRAYLRREESLQPERRFFEIVHLPEDRLGNVLTRSVLRDLELRLLGRSGAPQDSQLTIDDLLVSVRGEQIVLRSRRLGCELVPRLSTAHNTHWRAVGIYRFLADLQSQGVQSGLSFQWGPLEALKRLPRVRCDGIVLSPRRWNATATEFDGMRELEPAEFHAAFRDWARRRGLPRCVLLQESDHRLPLDIDDPLSVEAFWAVAKQRSRLIFDEPPHLADACVVHSPEGAFVHELVLPFVRREPAARQAALFQHDALQTAQVMRQPGSEWLYARLYCGKQNADRILTERLGPWLEQRSRGLGVEGWFFLRYSDPYFHLRVRLRGAREALLTQVQPSLLACLEPAITDGAIWSVQFDRYEREVLRYGGLSGLEVAEAVFDADSSYALSALRYFADRQGELARWLLVALGLDRLLDPFLDDPLRRYALYERIARGYREEFAQAAELHRQIRARFRETRSQLAQTLDDGVAELELPLQRRTRALRRAGQRLVELSSSGELCRSVEDLLGSYLHLHANRMCRSAARAQEAVLYSLLALHYDSLLARQGIKGRVREQRLAQLREVEVKAAAATS